MESHHALISLILEHDLVRKVCNSSGSRFSDQHSVPLYLTQFNMRGRAKIWLPIVSVPVTSRLAPKHRRVGDPQRKHGAASKRFAYAAAFSASS
jgi:hypothetical protein